MQNQNFNQKEYFIIPLSLPKNINMSTKIYEKVVAVTCRKKTILKVEIDLIENNHFCKISNEISMDSDRGRNKKLSEQLI